jgi:hypothetical protein
LSFCSVVVLNSAVWTSPPYQEPGGTIYVPNKARIYYPQGTDWSRDDVTQYYILDVHAHIFHWDHQVPYTATQWMTLREKAMLTMQQRHLDRRMFAVGEYDTYEGSEQWIAWCIADTYLIFWLDEQNALKPKQNWLVDNK